MAYETATALATGLLVVVGFAQVVVLIAQLGVLRGERQQHRLELIETYRRRWSQCKREWGAVVFLGSEFQEYYQVVDKATITEFAADCVWCKDRVSAVWALDSVREVTQILSDVCVRILQGHLSVSDAYPIFGTELLRHSRSLRVILEPTYPDGPNYSDVELDDMQRAFAVMRAERPKYRLWALIKAIHEEFSEKRYRQGHKCVRGTVQNWLSFHEGTRRRCLILIDLLWSEAARLEDLPAYDLWRAAEAKKQTGGLNRRRLVGECLRLNGHRGIVEARKLSRFLKHGEYRRFGRAIGVGRRRLKERDPEWTGKLMYRPQETEKRQRRMGNGVKS